VSAPLEVGVFAPGAVLSEMPAVVAPEHYNGIPGQASLFERRHEPPDLSIDIADAGEIGVNQLS